MLDAASTPRVKGYPPHMRGMSRKRLEFVIRLSRPESAGDGDICVGNRDVAGVQETGVLLHPQDHHPFSDLISASTSALCNGMSVTVHSFTTLPLGEIRKVVRSA